MTVFRQGQVSQGLMLVALGKGVFVRQGSDEQIGQIASGEYINEAALFNEPIESASLMVVETMIVLLLARARFTELLTRMPAMRSNLLTPGTPHAPITPAAPSPPRVPAAPSGVASRPTLPPRMPETPAAPLQRVPSTPPVVNTPLMFEWQREGESIMLLRRRHAWAVIRYALIGVPILILVGVIAAALAAANGLLAAALMGVGVVIVGVWIAYLYMEWKDDYLAITNQRVVRASNHLLRMENEFSEIPLDRIIEVNLSMPRGDMLARLLNYGTIALKTAGQNTSVGFAMIPDPASVQSAIFAQRDLFRQNRPSTPPVEPTVNPADLRTPRGLFFARTRFVNDKGNLVYRKHASVWLAHVITPLGVVLIGIGVMIASAAIADWILRGALGLIVGAVIAGAGAIAFYLGDWDWRSDLYILTRATVTIVRKRPLWLQNQVETIRLGQVENVVSDMSGLLNTMLKRGVVKIYMLGANKGEAKILGPLYNPHELQAELSRRQQAIKADAAPLTGGYGNAYRAPAGPTTAPPVTVTRSPRPDGIRPPKVPRARTDHDLE